MLLRPSVQPMPQDVLLQAVAYPVVFLALASPAWR
jgi:hypothetical protein